MDDGARTPRYTPFFVNSGFFFVKYNERTKYFQEKMMKNGAAEIGRSHSHQSVMIKHLSEAHHLLGLKVYLYMCMYVHKYHSYDLTFVRGSSFTRVKRVYVCVYMYVCIHVYLYIYVYM
jgi:hypothetical protein